MRRPLLSILALAALIATGTAQAAVTLIAHGTLAGDGHDLSGLTGTLESGAPADSVGGLGSGLAWAGGSTFIALPDRGPNATAWNADIDNTTSWIPRLQTLDLQLSPAAPGSALPFDLAVALTKTTLLWSGQPLHYGPAVPAQNTKRRHYFSGRSDNFAAGSNSIDPNHARLDPEGIRVGNGGRTAFISDEYGPYVYHFDLTTGRRLHAIPLPANLAAANLSAQGAVEISGNTQGRVANKGMEGLAISPSGKRLAGFMQSPLIQDGGDGGRANRIVVIDLPGGETRQFAYDNYVAANAKAYNSSEVLALNEHELLVLERDGKGLGDGSAAVVKQIYKVDYANAEDVSNLSGAEALLARAPVKTLFLDVKAALNAAGFADTQIPAKLEGMAFGEDIEVDGVRKHTLYIANDNDFLATAPDGQPNPNQFFVFAFDASDLGGSVFRNQRIKR